MIKKIILSIVILLISIISFFLIYHQKNNEILVTKKDNSNFISMMVENENGEYIEKTDNNFPIEGYLFNAEKSSCENGGILSWNEEKKKVQASLLTSDKCYAYFDKDELGSICKNENLAECFIKNYQKDSSIIYHDGKADYEGEENYDLEAEDLSYRYTGGNDIVYNYVCLDGKTESGACTSDDDLYRFIGLFKNEEDQYEAKLIKADYTTEEQTGTAPSVYGSTTSSTYKGDASNLKNIAKYVTYGEDLIWANSTFNKVNLNVNFINYLQKKLSKTNFITNHLWIVSLKNSVPFYNAKVAYQEEIAKFLTSEKYQAQIGLMYISDFYYSAKSKYWSLIGFAGHDASQAPNDYRSAINDNWMYMGLDEWTISLGGNPQAHRVYPDGKMGTTDPRTGELAIRPVFYISSTIKLASGNGSKQNPYRLK